MAFLRCPPPLRFTPRGLQFDRKTPRRSHAHLDHQALAAEPAPVVQVVLAAGPTIHDSKKVS